MNQNARDAYLFTVVCLYYTDIALVPCTSENFKLQFNTIEL